MAIELIIEDGSGIENANSYTDLVYARIYALNRGILLSSNDDELSSFSIKATDYLETLECRFQGNRSFLTQNLSFPRTGVYLNGSEDPLPINVIPKSLINAQIQLIIEQTNGFDLMPTVSPQDYVKKTKVGPIETEYSDPLSIGIMPVFTAVNALLAPLFGECSTPKFSLRTIRV